MNSIEVCCPICSDIYTVTNKDSTKSRYGKTYEGGCFSCLTAMSIRFPTKEDIANFEQDIMETMKFYNT
jgi:hypothetical protein